MQEHERIYENFPNFSKVLLSTYNKLNLKSGSCHTSIKYKCISLQNDASSSSFTSQASTINNYTKATDGLLNAEMQHSDRD